MVASQVAYEEHDMSKWRAVVIVLFVLLVAAIPLPELISRPTVTGGVIEAVAILGALMLGYLYSLMSMPRQ